MYSISNQYFLCFNQIEVLHKFYPHWPIHFPDKNLASLAGSAWPTHNFSWNRWWRRWEHGPVRGIIFPMGLKHGTLTWWIMKTILWSFICIYICIYVYVHIYWCVLYIYIYIYVFIHIQIYIYEIVWWARQNWATDKTGHALWFMQTKWKEMIKSF